MNLKQLTQSDNPMVILSLREPYFKAMLSGEKCFEYRKTYKNMPTIAIVYISRTLKSIAGVIEFGTPIIDNPDAISKLAVSHNEATYTEMMAYFGERKAVYAIPIKRIYTYATPISVEDLKTQGIAFRAPQSYKALDEMSDLYTFLKDKALQEH